MKKQEQKTLYERIDAFGNFLDREMPIIRIDTISRSVDKVEITFVCNRWNWRFNTIPLEMPYMYERLLINLLGHLINIGTPFNSEKRECLFADIGIIKSKLIEIWGKEKKTNDS